MGGHINFEEGWRVLEEGIMKCSKILEGYTNARPTAAEFMKYYDCAYTMATQKTQYCQEMYDGYKGTLADCVRIMVLPHLMYKHNEYFLRELVRMWSNYCLMVKLISGFLSYMDCCFVQHRKIPSLGNAAAATFFGQVFSHFNHEVTDAVLTLIHQERKGNTIDMDLLMDAMRGIFRSEMNVSMKNDVLQDTFVYYSRKSSEWILEYSLPDYLSKVQESMEKESERLARYLFLSGGESWQLCLQVVNSPLMQTYETYSRDKQISGQLLLQTYKTVEEELLARCSGLTLGGSSDNDSCSYME